MPELKQPQEAAETTTEQPLTTKKKRAMLEYMAIMFAAAFLLVADVVTFIYPCSARLNHKAAGIRAVRREHMTDNASVAVFM